MRRGFGPAAQAASAQSVGVDRAACIVRCAPHGSQSGSLIGSHTTFPTGSLARLFGVWSFGRWDFIYGGVLDSTLGWSAPLPVESRGSLVNSPAKQINGKTEEMPLAA
jgi:hypothetical protein